MSISRKHIVWSLGAQLAMASLLGSAAAPARGEGLTGKVAASSSRAGAQPALPAAPGPSTLAPAMTLAEGKSTLMRLPFPAARLSVGEARIADVILLNASEVYLVGKSPGTTNLILWNQANEATIIDITVQMEIGGLEARIAQLFPTEKDIHVSSAADTVILSGVVADPMRADQIMMVANAHVQRGARGNQQAPAGIPATAGAAPPAAGASAGGQNTVRVINMLSVAAPQQVMLEVKVAEVSKTLVDQLGVSIGAATTRGSWTYTFLTDLLTGKPNLIDGFNKKNGNFVTLDAEKRDALVKVLAEPNIMAISGQEASFLAGGKIFIPVSVTNGNGVPTITLEEKEFGIAVKFTPTVLEGGRINLRVAPEVSDLNKDGIGISAAGVGGNAILPAFTTRRASTTVQLFDGQSFAIGGLIKNNVVTNIKAFPVLGELPLLGALFRSSDFQTDRTELVFIVTPHLVKPLPVNYQLPTDGYIQPSRSEFFLGGRHEGRSPPANAKAPTGFDLN